MTEDLSLKDKIWMRLVEFPSKNENTITITGVKDEHVEKIRDRVLKVDEIQFSVTVDSDKVKLHD